MYSTVHVRRAVCKCGFRSYAFPSKRKAQSGNVSKREATPAECESFGNVTTSSVRVRRAGKRASETPEETINA